MFLKTQEYVEVKEMLSFEKYAIKRFNISGVDFKIDLRLEEKPPIKENWNDLLIYFFGKKSYGKSFLKK